MFRVTFAWGLEMAGTKGDAIEGLNGEEGVDKKLPIFLEEENLWNTVR